MYIMQRTIFLWFQTCRGRSIVREFLKHSLPRGSTRCYPPRFLDECKHTCWYAHPVPPVHFGFRRTTKLHSLPLSHFTSSLFLHSTFSLREYVTLLTAQDAKGNVYRSAGKTKRFAYQAVSSIDIIRLRFHAYWDSGKQAAYTWTLLSKGRWHHWNLQNFLNGMKDVQDWSSIILLLISFDMFTS